MSIESFLKKKNKKTKKKNCNFVNPKFLRKPNKENGITHLDWKLYNNAIQEIISNTLDNF